MPRAPRPRAPGAWRWSLLAAIAVGCTTNESDNLAASKLGDVSRPAQRGAPACGSRIPPSIDDPAPVRFLVFGDSGGGNADQHALARQMHDVPFALILHTGDLTYERGYERTVFDVYGDLLACPFFPAAGNHDDAATFRSVFGLPTTYSFDWGRVHFVALDTEADYAAQARWLDADLSATRRPWKIVYMHRPPYSSGVHGSDLDLRETLAPVFEKHGVQLVLAGHDHDYERTWPQRGTYYVVTGGGGIGTRDVGTSSFTAFSDDVIHFVYVEVTDDKLVLHAIDGTGEEFDSLVITRGSERSRKPRHEVCS